MSSNGQFKCLIQINNYRFTFSIDNSHSNHVRFEQVYNKIVKIDTKPSISTKTHFFEIFDKDFNEYVVIEGYDRVIDNFSRIRVSLKPKSVHFNTFNNNSQHISDGEQHQNFNTVVNNENKSKYRDIINSTKKFDQKTLIKDEIFTSLHSCDNLKPVKKKIKREAQHCCQILSVNPIVKHESSAQLIDISSEHESNDRTINRTKNNDLNKSVKVKSEKIESPERSSDSASAQSLIDPKVDDNPNTNTFSYKNFRFDSNTQTICNSTKTKDVVIENCFDDLKGVDKLLVIDSEKCNDIERVTSIKRELNKMSQLVKEEYYEHGIRLKDGSGINAYMCLKCNVSFESLLEVMKHLQSFGQAQNESIINSVTNNFTTDSYKKWSIDTRLKNEGIRKRINYENNKEEFFCIFCRICFESEHKAIVHLNGSYHRRTKCGDHFYGIFREFTVRSERIDEFEVAFARMKILTSVVPTSLMTKFIDQGIRLKDGIGSHAYVCQLCRVSIANKYIDDGLNSINLHLNSLKHNKINLQKY